MRAAGVETHVAVVNVADRPAADAFADDVTDRFGRVDMLLNNAGITAMAPFTLTAHEDFERVFGIDFWGVYNGMRAFLPGLIASGDGHPVNVSSLFGLLGTPPQTTYNTAKFTVRGLTESLRQEMLAGRHPVTVAWVHPRGTRTGIVRSSWTVHGAVDHRHTQFFQRVALTSPDRAARVILRRMARREGRVLISPDAKVMDAAVRIVGPHYQRPGAWAARRAAPGWFEEAASPTPAAVPASRPEQQPSSQPQSAPSHQERGDTDAQSPECQRSAN